MKTIKKLQKGNIIHLADGRSARVVATYYNRPLKDKVMAEILGKNYSACNYQADMIPLSHITKVTS
jgi:hypothetical protein